MHVAIGGVGRNMDIHAVFCAKFGELMHNFGNAGHRNHRVFGRKNQAAGPIGFTEGFARLPDFHRVGDQHFQRAVGRTQFVNEHALVVQHLFVISVNRQNHIVAFVAVRQFLVEKRLGAADALVVHEFDAKRMDRRLHHLGHYVDRRLSRGKHRQQIHDMFRTRNHFQQHLGHDPQRSFRSDDQLGQSIAGRVFF